MKALILTVTCGGGHNAAAAAVAEALAARGVESRTMNCVDFASKWIARQLAHGYANVVRYAPAAFGVQYKAWKKMSNPDRRSVSYGLNSTYAKRIQRLLDSYQPDMVICTHLFGGEAVTHLKKHGRYKGLLCMVQTDYTIHPFMENVKADVVCVGHRDVLPECRAMKIPEESMKVFGIPVSGACKPCTDKRAAKQAIGLDPDTREVLLVGSPVRQDWLAEALQGILKILPEDAHLTVVCGEKSGVQKKMEKFGDPRLTVLGRVSPLTARMAAADVLVSKAGGLTSTESMTIGVPLVVFRPISGCETANAAFFERNGLAAWAKKPGDMPALVKDLLDHPEKREAMIQAQYREIGPDSAARLVDHLLSLLQG